MPLQSNEISKWYESLEDVKADGYTPIKCFSPLCFFRMRGRTSTLIKENLEPIPDLKYIVLSPKEERYYLKEYREWDIDSFYFYRKTLDFSGDDPAREQLRRYIDDDNVWLLFTDEMVEDTKAMLARVYNGHFTKKGTIAYRDYINLLEQSLRYKDYKEYGKSLTGFKTVSNQFQKTIRGIWLSAYNKQNKT